MEDELSTNEEVKWRRNVREHKREITSCLNPFDLIPYFDSHDLLSLEEKETLFIEATTRDKKVRYLLEVLETTDIGDAYTVFFECLHKDVEDGGNIGHQFLHALLLGEQYATEEEYEASEDCRLRIKQFRKDMYDINLKSLVPVMIAHGLITRNEQEILTDDKSRTQMDRIERLLLFLDTKGPLAHKVFFECLGKDPPNTELYKRVTQGELTSSRRHTRKRKRDASAECSIPKRVPERIRMEEPLCGDGYYKFVTCIRKCYQKSLWKQLESEADKFIQSNSDPQLKAMGIIEKGYSFSCRRKMGEKALECLGVAKCLIGTRNGGNYKFLMARCKHIGGTIQRYLGNDDKSLEENEKAFDLLFNCERSDDASRITYGLACARLEKLGKNPNVCAQEIMDIEELFTRAIDYGRSGNPGMCASKDRCLIRKAQLSLGTSTLGICMIKATEGSINQAEVYLKQVEVDSISQRCLALYYVIESDLFKSKGNVTQAIASSEKALRIAKESSLGAELVYAKSRLQSLPSVLQYIL